MNKIRVIQYASGTTGKVAIRAMANHPELELVGLLVHNRDKVGRDAGELAGIENLGITATDSLEEILALEADAVSFMGLWPDLDLVCPMLESGKHVVLTPGLIYPKYLGDEVVKRLEAACNKGGSCVFGGGISPGFVQCVAPIAMSNLARSIDSITVEEFVDFHDVGESPELIRDMLGIGRTLEDVKANKHPWFDEMMPDFFNQTVALTADALMLELDSIEANVEHFVSPGGGRIEAVEIPPGSVGGVRSTFTGIADGRARIVVKLHWWCTHDLGDDWFSSDDISNSTQWRITVDGEPSMRLTFEQADHFNDPAGNPRKSTEHSFIITAMNVLHAIPYLCKEKVPGIKHYANLPLMAGRYTIR